MPRIWCFKLEGKLKHETDLEQGTKPSSFEYHHLMQAEALRSVAPCSAWVVVRGNCEGGTVCTCSDGRLQLRRW